jgi:hypothetical protein
MTTNHIQIHAEPIVFTGESIEARPERGLLRIEPDGLVEFPGHPVDEDLIQFRIDVKLPGLTATTGDELTKQRIRQWRDDLVGWLRTITSGKLPSAAVELTKCTEGFDILISAHSGRLLLECSVDFPYRGWHRTPPTVMLVQEKPTPWSIRFGLILEVDTIADVVLRIDTLLASLPMRSE